MSSHLQKFFTLLAFILCFGLDKGWGAIIPVTSTNDAGAGSLRAAIQTANASPGHDTLTFVIGSGAQSINATTNFPFITDEISLDGTTQPGFSGTPLITLSRYLQFSGVNGTRIEGLRFAGNNSGLYGNGMGGLVIRNCAFEGISTAISITNSSDIDIRQNTFDNNNSDIRLTNINTLSLPRGILIDNNSYLSGGNIISLNNVPGQVISDGSLGGTNISLPNGSYSYTGTLIDLRGADSSIVASLNLGGASGSLLSTLLRVANSDSLLIENNQLDSASIAIDVDGASRVWLRNNGLANIGSRAIDVFNCSNLYVLNNALSNTGTAIYLNTINAGLEVFGNTFAGGNIGMDLIGLPPRQIISDGSYPGTTINIPRSALRGFRSSALQLNNLDSCVVANLNLNDTSTSNNFSDYGLYALNCDSLALINCDFRDRRYGVDARNMSDLSILNCSFANNTTGAIRLTNVNAIDLPRGILINGNSFSGGGTGIYLNGAPPQVISDGGFAGTNIILGSNDLSGFSLYGLELINTDSLVLTGLNLSGLGRTLTNGSLRLADVDSALIQNNVLGNASRGIDADRVRSLWVQANSIPNTNSAALDVLDGEDVRILNNSFSNNYTAIQLNTIRRGTALPRGVLIDGNSFSQGSIGFWLTNMVQGQVISDGSFANTNIYVPQQAMTGYSQYAFYINGMDSAIIANLNLSDTSSVNSFSYGVYANNCDSFLVQNCSLQNRNRGLEIINGSDIYLRNNVLSNNSSDAIRLANISAGNLARGISIIGNSFGGGGTALELSSVPPQVISDGSFPSSNIVVGTNDFSGFSSYGIELYNTDSTVISGLNLSGLGRSQTSGAITLQACDSILIQNNNLGDCRRGVTANSVSNLWVQNNAIGNNSSRAVGISTGRDIRILNNAFSDNGTAIYLNTIRAASLPRGVLVQNNTFSGGNYGMEIYNTSNQVISDGNLAGTSIHLGTNDLSTFTSYPLYLINTDSILVANLNLSSLGASTSQASIWVSSSDSVLVQNNTLNLSNRGVDVNSSNRVWIQGNTLANNNQSAINANGGTDIRILNNGLSNSGTAFTLNGIGANLLSGGILINGNTLNGGNTGLAMTNLPSGLVVSDGTYPNSHISLPSQSMTGFGTSAIVLSSVDSIVIANLNLGDTTSSSNFGYGVRAASCDSVAIINCGLTNRSIGVEGNIGRDFSITNSNFGSNTTTAIQLWNIGALDLTRGILVNGNSFDRGGTGIYLYRTAPQVISNGSFPNTSIALDSTSLIDFSNYALRLEDVDSTVISNLDLSGPNIANKAASILLQDADSALIQNCFLGDAGRSLNIDRSNRIWIQNNDLVDGIGVDASQVDGLWVLNNNFSNTATALSLSSLGRGVLAAGIRASGNTFNGGNTGISLSSCPPLTIGDTTSMNSDVLLGTNDLTTFTTVGIFLTNTDSVSISGLNLSNLVSAGRTGTGVQVNSGDHIRMDRLNIRNRAVGIGLSSSSFDTLSCTQLVDNSTGISLGTFSNSNRVFDCNIEGNGSGINRSTSIGNPDTLNAEGNFWGASNGPSNLGGNGDSYFGAVDADPFLAGSPGCIPLDTCSLILTGQAVNCLPNNAFEITFSFTGVGNTYRVADGTTILLDSIPAGTYTVGPFPRGTSVSLLLSDLSFTNCDTSFTLINPVSNTSLSASICEGDSLGFGGGFLRNAGTYRDTLQSGTGCDSIITLSLSVIPLQRTIQNVQICQGQSFNFGGQVISGSGTYIDTLTAINGCDSISTLNLSVVPVLQTNLSQAICQGDSLFFAGQYLTQAGTYRDTLQSVAGCDSVRILDLSINPSYSQVQNVSLCASQLPFSFGSQVLTAGGTYVDSLQTLAGCDSIITLNLSIDPADTTYLSATSCSPSQVGSDTTRLTNQWGCDSLVIRTTTLLASDTTNLNASICDNQSYIFNGQTLTTTGVYQVLLTNQAGCDSLVVLNLTVNPTLASRDSAFICTGQSYVFGSQVLATSGTYTEIFTSNAGCDSLVTLELRVGNQVLENIGTTICQGDSFRFGGRVLYNAGLYRDTLQSRSGCDSIVVLDLRVLPPGNQVWNISICENDLPYQFAGQSLALSGTYVDSLVNVNGCDSLITLNLTVNSAYYPVIDTSIGVGDTFFFAGQGLTSSGTYVDSLQTLLGCDSIITLNLQVQQPAGLVAPTNLVVDDSRAFLAVLDWQDNSGNEDGFRILRDGQVIAILGPNVTSYQDSVLVFGRTITYEVEAFEGSQTSAPSNPDTYAMPKRFERLELTYICYNPEDDSLTWKVENPNIQAHPYIWAQWWNPARDTLFAPPGLSMFKTKRNNQSAATYGNDNITGIWWADHTLRPGIPNEIVFSIDTSIDCRFLRGPEYARGEKAGPVFRGSMTRDISFEDQRLFNQILETDLAVLPNPFEDQMTLRMKFLRGAARLRLMNTLGQEVFVEDVRFTDEDLLLELRDVAKGIYLLQVQLGPGTYTMKVVKK